MPEIRDRPTSDPDPGPAARDGSHGSGLLGAAVADRLPAALRGGRVGVDGRAVLALALLGVVAVLAGASYLWRAQARPAEVVPPRALPVASPTAAPSGVLVHVAGRVRTPGVVSLPAGSRVADALTAAGGAAPGADLAAVNLARPLQDGEQIVVPTPGAAPTGGPAGSAAAPGSGPLDLNTATAEQLETLPGVGPVLAQRIVEWRERHGRFSSIDELREVSGIGDAKFADLADKVRV